ncbi:MAG: carboxypeptidase-like regulatory domain-containing protein [Bacteroidales bacterium]|nr:carboxypeptidase-like regulatory domain-containing protein [Bacteroidales bacterium]
MKRLFITIVIILCGFSIVAQNKYFLLKGYVVSADSLSPIPNVHILSELSYYGTTSDHNGIFSMLIRKNDTLRISSVGFVTQLLPINYDSINTNNYLIKMEIDTIMLQEVDVFPYLDYNTVKKIVSEIPIEKPFVIKGVNDDIEQVIYQKPKKIPDDKGVLSPIQTLYNRFNKKERLKRKMERNRRKLGIES